MAREKDFSKKNLTAAFFGTPEEDQTPENKTQDEPRERRAQDEPTKTINKSDTKRSKRVQVLLTPAEYEALRTLAFNRRVSESKLILDALKEAYEEIR